MGKTRSNSGNFEESGRKLAFRQSLTQDQILELQDALNEFFLTEKEKVRLGKIFLDEKKDMEMDFETGTLEESIDDSRWEDDEQEE